MPVHHARFSFRRLSKSVPTDFRYGYTTNGYGSNSSCFKCAERHHYPHLSVILDSDCNYLGMKDTIVVAVHRNSLLEFGRLPWDKRNNIHVKANNKKVLTGIFDRYRSNPIATDHLIFGVRRTFSTACMKPSIHLS